MPSDASATFVPDAHDPTKRHLPIMFTTDLSLKFDPRYREIAKRFQQNPDEYALAFAKAWFKLTHRDLGPRSRYLGTAAPQEVLLWQDPVPAVDHALVNAQDIAQLKSTILASGLGSPELVRAAWASAASFRGSDMRGGANGARVRLDPQRNWEVNNPAELAKVLKTLEGIQGDFNRAQTGGKKISLAELIVLGGAAAVERAAKQAGHEVQVAFRPGRTDASQAQTDVQSFTALEPAADGFRNYFGKDSWASPAEMLVDPSEPADADGAGDDGAGRRPARVERQFRAVGPRRGRRSWSSTAFRSDADGTAALRDTPPFQPPQHVRPAAPPGDSGGDCVAVHGTLAGPW